MSKGKGSAFERKICRQLSDWWSGDTSGDVRFWRTAGSGGRATSRTKRGQKTNTAHCGDIAALDDDAAILTRLIAIEVKRGYNTATLHALVDRPASAAAQLYEEWIAQAEESMRAANAQCWAIIHARDRRETLITFWGWFNNGDMLKGIARYGPLLRLMLPTHYFSIYSCRLDHFLGAVRPEHIRAISESFQKMP